MATTHANGRIPIPREHGGWAMLLTPSIVAMLSAGPSLLGILALLGWVAGYCVRGPVEVLRGTGASGKAGMARTTPQAARIGLLLFGGLAIAFLGPVIILRPWSIALLAGALVVLASVQLLADRGLTRSISAGLLAVVGLMAGGPLYYLAATGRIPAEGWVVAITSAAFFGGSVFRVKTLARERRSAGFRGLSVAVHLAAFAFAAVAAAVRTVPWLVPVALLPALFWSIYGAARVGAAMNLNVIGKGEQWLTILFGALLIVALI